LSNRPASAPTPSGPPAPKPNVCPMCKRLVNKLYDVRANRIKAMVCGKCKHKIENG
jgi:hypothetical protein